MRLLLLFSFLMLTLFSSAQTFSWAKQFGGNSDCHGNDIATDAAGNVYTVGYLNGTHDMDPGPGVFNLTQASGAGVYISKLDVNGNFVWARQFTGWNLVGYSIALDASGNIFTSGFFQQVADFDPGPAVSNLLAPMGSHGFICKLDNNGNFIWARQIGGTGNVYLQSYDLDVDAVGNVYSAGFFNGNADFDPGPAVLNMVSGGLNDNYVVKLDGNGDLVWAKQFTGTADGESLGIAVDGSGTVYTTGIFMGTVDFDPGPATANLSTTTLGSASFFISKLDINGNYVWARQVSGASQGLGRSITINGGSAIITGYFRGSADFDPGPLSTIMTATGGVDLFILKLDAGGNLAWVKQIGGTGDDEGKRIVQDPTNNIYLTGYFQNSVDFDPGPSTSLLSSTGSYEAFIAKFDNNGNLGWAKQVGGAGADMSFSASADALGNVYATGRFNATADFDPGTATFNLTSLGADDAFVLKLRRCNNITTSTLTTTACNTFTLNNQVYTASGTYTQTIQNVEGCDSIITLNLTMGGSTTNFSQTACDSYVWNGQNYTASGLYTQTFTGADGCDSIVNLNLTISNSIFTTVTASICEGESYAGYTTSGTYSNSYVLPGGCDSTRILELTVKPRINTNITANICQGEQYQGYTVSGTYTNIFVGVNGCDSIRTLQLVVGAAKLTNIDASICEGQSYFAAGAAQTTSGTYRDTLQAQLGCDSIVITRLSVNPKPRPNLGADRNICLGTTVTFNPGAYNSYTWQDMSTSPTFNASGIGLYWVTVTDNNNCSATDTVRIATIHTLPVDFLKQKDSVCDNGNLTIQPLTNFTSYQWSTGTTQNSIVVVDAGNYWLKVVDANGCMGTDTIAVYLKGCGTGVFIPTAFTPNGDGKNDLFKAVLHGKVSSFKLEVYDRAGQLIFRTTNPDMGWNGAFKGVYYTSSVFVWQCSYQLEGEKPAYQKGTLALVR